MSHRFVIDTSNSPNATHRPVAIDAVTLNDPFWEPRRRINRDATLFSQYEQCESTHRLDNFRVAAGRKKGEFVGIYFNDSDVYKWLEAAASSLATHPEEKLRHMVSTVVDDIAAAQQPDGYLNSYFMFDRAKERWSNLKDKHEMYCAGHLIQAAVAHHRATGADGLLRVASRLADHLCDTFGPEGSGKRQGCCGHEEIEMALIELARETANRRYLEQAKYFLDARGRGLIGGSAYHQDATPVREMDRMIGHAVRHVYLACGMADLCAETDDPAMRAALERLWANMTDKQLYLTGGIGSRYEGEAFGRDFELPAERAYTETCAAIGSAMWNWRMVQIARDDRERARYTDLIELALSNAMLSGLSLDGQEYFYQNPLTDDGTHRRQKWFGCACCPPNVARVLAQLPGYFYGAGRDDDAIYVHLYAHGHATISLSSGRSVVIEQATRYPWDESIELRVREIRGDAAAPFALKLRVPAWCSGATLSINGQERRAAESGTYAIVNRTWKAGDAVKLELPMPVRFVEAHAHAAEYHDRLAIMRGPLVYCGEGVDNPGFDLRDALVSPGDATVTERPDLLGGVVTIDLPVQIREPAGPELYRAATSRARAGRDARLVLIPYPFWANRAPGRMQVWFKRA